jgi:hypothetical protein
MQNRFRRNQAQFAHRMVRILLLLSFLILSSCSAAIRTKTTPTTQEPLAADSSPTPVPPQKLRIVNQSAYTLHQLRVRFPDEAVDFGDVLPGVTTEYQVFSRGVYRYAGYEIELNGQNYDQVPYDFLGETPMNGNAFTYILVFDPVRKTDPVHKTGIEVIQLVDVKKDQ